MTKFAGALALAFCLTACGLEVVQRPGTTTAGGAIDHSSPSGLADAIFAAAKSGDLASLATIASDTADPEVLDLANAAKSDQKFQQMFREFFSSGRVAAEPYLDGNGAAFVPIVYGKTGDKEKIMVMAKSAAGAWRLDALVDAVDQSSPEALAKSIFRAAKTGIFSGMKGIAAQVSDGDVKDIANVASAAPEFKEMFREHFAKGTINGDVLVKDNQAMVPILFGKNGDKEETLSMVKQGERWFFSNF